ncbi:MAG: hypothetical protein JWO86_7194 [Myxococcaceae bacterium]|nr:hypothetical protein [Myxococcaceae bacterium]
MRTLTYAWVTCVALALVQTACSAKTRASIDGNADGGPAGSSGGFVPQDGGGTTPVLAQCADANKDVYVIAEDRTFYSFHPPTVEFKAKGILNCPTGGAMPTSMAVDREGTAWVRHSDGTVWKVSTTDLSCELTKYQPQAEAFTKFGMGFATESKGGSAETLYLSDSNGAGLAKLDTKTLSLSFIGPYTGDLAGTTSELTGTGDGKLYGFFVTSPAQIGEISKATGDIIDPKPLTGVYAGNAWAFSFYGGDFFIYTSSDGSSGLPRDNGGSDVTRYSPADGSITVVKSKIGFKIVGAGVSTCAPTTSVR